MVERKLYKTKICLLYQKGRCSRQHCSFAHGSAELRRSFHGSQEYGGGRDLRERLDRMRSPLHRSPVRGDPKARHSSRGDTHHSPGRRANRNHQRRNHFDDHTDISGRISDGTEDQIKDRRHASSDTTMHINEKLREMHSEIEMLESDKQKLKMYLEDKVKEADTLTSKTQELEVQLSKEKEDGKRFTAKIKKFIKAHKRHLRLQDDLKRSHAQLQKLGDQLDLNAFGPDIEEDLRTNTINEDITGAPIPVNEGQVNLSPQRKRSRVLLEVHDASNQGRTEIGSERVENFSQQSRSHNQLSNGKKSEADYEYNDRGLMAHEGKLRRVINQSADIDKVTYMGTWQYPKVSEMDITTLPSTGMAAHALDEDVELGDTFRAATKIQRLPFLPPLIPPNIYAQYKADDERVDIDGVDEEMVEVDVV